MRREHVREKENGPQPFCDSPISSVMTVCELSHVEVLTVHVCVCVCVLTLCVSSTTSLLKRFIMRRK